MFFFNYRSDRVREVTQLMGDFDRSPKPDFPYPKDIHVTTMTQYNVKYPFPVAFPPQKMDDVYMGRRKEWGATHTNGRSVNNV